MGREMPKNLMRCKVCGRYTLRKDRCPYCGGEVIPPYPPKFSPIDKYIEYRIKMKREGGVYSSST